MIIYFVIFLLFLVLLFTNYKKTILFYAAFKILLNSGISLTFEPPSLTLELAINLSIIIYYFLFKFKKSQNTDFPFKYPFILMSISYILSSVFTNYSASIAFTTTTRLILNDFVFVYILWKVIQSKKDLHFIIKFFLIISFILCIYSLFEIITNSNPIMKWESSLIPPEFNTDKIFLSSTTDLRFGRIRSQSLFPISISFGAFCLLFFTFIIFYFQNFKSVYRISYIPKIIIISLLFMGIFLSNSRTPMFALPIFILAIANHKIIKLKTITILAIITVLLIPFVIPYLSAYSSISESSTNSVGGSSIEMRLKQLETSFDSFLESPIVGNGIRYSGGVLAVEKRDEILGAESIWFILLIEQGVIGIISFILMYIITVNKLVNIDKQFILLFTLGWIILNSFSSLPSIGNGLFYTFLVIIIKSYLINIKYKLKITNSKINTICC